MTNYIFSLPAEFNKRKLLYLLFLISCRDVGYIYPSHLPFHSLLLPFFFLSVIPDIIQDNLLPGLHLLDYHPGLYLEYHCAPRHPVFSSPCRNQLNISEIHPSLREPPSYAPPGRTLLQRYCSRNLVIVELPGHRGDNGVLPVSGTVQPSRHLTVLLRA